MADSAPSFHVYQKQKIRPHIDAVASAVNARGMRGRLTRIGLRGINKLSGSGLGNFAISVLGLKKLVRRSSRGQISAQNNNLRTAIAQDTLEKEHRNRFGIAFEEGSIVPDDLKALAKARDKAALAEVSKNMLTDEQPAPAPTPAPVPEQTADAPTSTYEAIDTVEEENYFKQQSSEKFTYSPLQQNQFLFLDYRSQPQIMSFDMASSTQTDLPSFLTLDEYERTLRAYHDLTEEEKQQKIKALEQSKAAAQAVLDQTEENDTPEQKEALAHIHEIDAAILTFQHSKDILSDLALAKGHDLTPDELAKKINNRDVFNYFDQSYRHSLVYQNFYDTDKVRIYSLAPYQFLEQQETVQSLKKEWSFDAFSDYLRSYNEKSDEEFSASIEKETSLTDEQKQIFGAKDTQEISEQLKALNYIVRCGDNICLAMEQAKAVHEGKLNEEELLQPVLSGYFFDVLEENELITPEDVKEFFDKQQESHLENAALPWTFEVLKEIVQASDNKANTILNKEKANLESKYALLTPDNQKRLGPLVTALHDFTAIRPSLRNIVNEVDSIDKNDFLDPSSGEVDINKVAKKAETSSFSRTTGLLLLAKIQEENSYPLLTLCDTFKDDQKVQMNMKATVGVEQPVATNVPIQEPVSKETTSRDIPEETTPTVPMTMALTVIPKAMPPALQKSVEASQPEEANTASNRNFIWLREQSFTGPTQEEKALAKVEEERRQQVAEHKERVRTQREQAQKEKAEYDEKVAFVLQAREEARLKEQLKQDEQKRIQQLTVEAARIAFLHTVDPKDSSLLQISRSSIDHTLQMIALQENSKKVSEDVRQIADDKLAFDPDLDQDDIDNPELQTGVVVEQQKAAPPKTQAAFAQNTDALGSYYQSSTMTGGVSWKVNYTVK